MQTRNSLPSKFRRLTACLIVTAYALLALFGTAFVECHELDGGVTVALAGSDCDCCCDDAADDAAAGGYDASPASGGSKCRTCFDVPLSERLAAASRSRQALPRTDAASAAAVVAAPPATFVAATTSIFVPRARPAPNPPPPPAAPRTVFLRC